jgi:hypothetical protein
MRKNRYEILRKNIVSGSLVSTTSQNWYDNDGNLIPWSGSIYIGPNIGDFIYNFTGSVDNKYSSSVNEGYYKWSGSSWLTITGITGTTPQEIRREINSQVYDTHQIPIFLESTVDEMGVMVGFDGNIEQVEQLVNFSYTQTGSTIQVYSTVNPDKLRKIVEQTYTINWGDGSPTVPFPINEGVPNTPLLSTGHTYSTPSGYTITITLDAPWTKQKLSKEIHTNDVFTGHTSYTGHTFGTFGPFTLPFTTITGFTQDYLNDFDITNNTGYTATGFKYVAVGGSRLDELKEYGSTGYTQTLTSGSLSGVTFTGYTFTYTGNTIGTTTLQYTDYEDGYTMITGSTTGFTKEDVFDVISKRLTRNEHFLGFIDEPTIYSDLFVERGKQGVMEINLRLGEIDNVGELDIYGNGYFNVRKQ